MSNCKFNFAGLYLLNINIYFIITNLLFSPLDFLSILHEISKIINTEPRIPDFHHSCSKA